MVNGLTITDISVFPVKNPQPESNLRAFAKIVLNEAFVISGIRVVNGSNGLFLGFPDRWNADEQKSYDIAFPILADLRNYITDEVLEALEKKLTVYNEAVLGKISPALDEAGLFF